MLQPKTDKFLEYSISELKEQAYQSLLSKPDNEIVLLRVILPPISHFKKIYPALQSKLLPQFYLKDRKGEKIYLAQGSLLEIASHSDYHAAKEAYVALENLPEGSKLFGGFSFFPKPQTNPWESFPVSYFFLPNFLWEFTKENTVLYMHFFKQHDEKENQDAIHALFDSLTQNLSLGTFTNVNPREPSCTPTFPQYKEIVEYALKNIRWNHFKKVVLAREVQCNCSLTAEEVLEALDNGEPSFLFYFRPDETSVFLGRSPELLLDIKKGATGASIVTEAVAGNRPRSKNPVENGNKEQELLHSEKDIQEHDFVVKYIEEVLDEFTTNLFTTTSNTLKVLQNVHHLYRTFRGKLKPYTSEEEILETFHPTPALGGYPKRKSLRFLEEHEIMDRGWYGAPIGFISARHSLFLVAIRSALLQGNRMHIFSGSGIVRQSDPGLEWQELNVKIKHFLDILEKADPKEVEKLKSLLSIEC
ncbi:MAG: isochorismate synthase [Candidatus Hydrogenedentota bacterium]|nr:MAG: isochorismate synthase [Candidatus Hydrogenedentota bacterium]